MKWIATFLTAALVFTLLDLLWLGVIMGDFYNGYLGPLKAKPVLIGPAALFYVFYLGFVVAFAVRHARNPRDSFIRGAGMGAFAYGTYELTNWAVIQNWPAQIVLPDMAWGIVLTGSVSWVSRLIFEVLSKKTFKSVGGSNECE